MFGNSKANILLIFFLVIGVSSIYSARRTVQTQPGATGLQVVKALFGDLTLQGGVSDVTANLQNSIRNNQLVLPAQTKVTWLGDPAPGKAKSLLIIFKIGNNVYLKLIADAAGDTISAATAQRAMLLIGQQQSNLQIVAAQQQPQPQPVQVQQAAATSMLAGTGVMVAQPGSVSQPAALTQQQQQFGALQQRRLQRFAR